MNLSAVKPSPFTSRVAPDCDGDPANAVSRDDMLKNITLYWATGAIGSSFWPYHAQLHRPWPIPPGVTVDVSMCRCVDGLHRTPARNFACSAFSRRTHVQRHPALDDAK